MSEPKKCSRHQWVLRERESLQTFAGARIFIEWKECRRCGVHRAKVQAPCSLERTTGDNVYCRLHKVWGEHDPVELERIAAYIDGKDRA